MLVESIAYIIYCMIHLVYFDDNIKNKADVLLYFGFVFFITIMFIMASYPDEDDKEKDNVKNYTSEDIIDEVEMYKDGKFQYKEYTMKDGTTIKISEETNQWNYLKS